MEDLTFGEQVKIILGRKGMTIKELAETIEAKTGKKMSRQNLTQRLGRDNFQEQDMRMIARILECPFQLSIMGTETARQTAEDMQEAAHNTAADARREENTESKSPAAGSTGSSRGAGRAGSGSGSRYRICSSAGRAGAWGDPRSSGNDREPG